MMDLKTFIEIAPYERIWPVCPKCFWFYSISEVNTNKANQVGGGYKYHYICSRKGCDQEEFVKDLPGIINKETQNAHNQKRKRQD